jgi:hypothetical protein
MFSKMVPLRPSLLHFLGIPAPRAREGGDWGCHLEDGGWGLHRYRLGRQGGELLPEQSMSRERQGELGARGLNSLLSVPALGLLGQPSGHHLTHVPVPFLQQTRKKLKPREVRGER